MTDKKVSKYIDGELLHKKMTERYEANKKLIERDYLGDPTRLEHQNWELKYWKEFIERTFGIGKKVK